MTKSPCPRDPSCTSCHVCDPDTYPALVAWRREGLRSADPTWYRDVIAADPSLSGDLRHAERHEHAPNIYSGPLAAMRAASVTEPSFEDGWKAERIRELAAQRGRMTAHLDAHPSAPRLMTAEVKSYAPPDPYADDIAKMRKENR